MRIFRRSRARPLAALVASAVVVGSLASSGIGPAPAGASSTQVPPNLNINWYVDADTLHLANPQEDGWFPEDGDEPLLSVVAFRTRPGVPGTTDVWKLSGFARLCNGADYRETCGISDAVGRASFGSVARGEILGTIQVTMEEDHTPTSSLNAALDQAVNMVEPELAALSESLTTADLANPSGLRSRIEGLISRITNAADSDRPWYEELFQRHFGSETIDTWVTLLVEAGGPQSRLAVNLVLLDAFFKPGSIVAAAALERRTWVIPHSGGGDPPWPRDRLGMQWDVTTRVYCTAATSIGTDPAICQ